MNNRALIEEQGIVLAINGEMAEVRIEREDINGCGCGASVRKMEERVTARNSCNAQINDRVKISSNYAIRKYRFTVQAGISLGICLAITGLGEKLIPPAGAVPSGAFAAGLGLLVGLGVYIAIEIRNRKNPLPRHTITGKA